jgi:hypothetical protein
MLVVTRILWTGLSHYSLSFFYNFELLTSLRYLQLIHFIHQIVGYFYFALVLHFFKSRIKSVVEIAHDEVVIANDIGIHFLTIDFECFDEGGHHFISLLTVVLPMKQVTCNEIEMFVIKFKVHVKTTFVTDFDDATANFFSTCQVVSIDDAAKHALFGLLDEGDYEHFIHVNGFHLFKPILFHEFVKSFNETCSIFGFLEARDDHIVSIG